MLACQSTDANAARACTEIATLLLRADASVHKLSRRAGQSALHLAAAAGKLELLSELLRYGAEINQTVRVLCLRVACSSHA